MNKVVLELAINICRRTSLIAVGIACIFLVALIFAVSALINPDRYRPGVISYLQGKTGRQVEIGRLERKQISGPSPLRETSKQKSWLRYFSGWPLDRAYQETSSSGRGANCNS
jgi:hypothetical protein